MIAATSLTVLDLLESSGDLRQKLRENSGSFRRRMTALGFTLVPGEHPIIPVMLGDAVLSQRMAERLLEEGIYVISFSYPVVPEGQARIRTQISAAHEPQHLDHAIAAFAKVGRELGVIDRSCGSNCARVSISTNATFGHSRYKSWATLGRATS